MLQMAWASDMAVARAESRPESFYMYMFSVHEARLEV